MSGIATINLVPMARRQARRSVTRITVWGVVVPVCCGLLVVAYLVQRFAGTPDLRAVEEALTEVHNKIKDDDKRIARQRVEIGEASAQLKANRAVGEQPDWSLLLALLTERLGSDAALTSLKLEPIVLASTTKAKSENAGSGGRPERLKLTISGVARSQAAASRFVLGLESAPAFDSVNLVETKRSAAEDAAGGTVTFQIACQLTDPSAQGGTVTASGEEKK